MKYRDRTNGEIFNIFELQQKFPNVSFPVVWDATTFDFANVDPVLEVAPPTPTSFANKVIFDGVQLIDGQWTETWIEVPQYDDPTQQAQLILEATEAQWGKVRANRELLLQQSDYTMMSDCPITNESKAEFITYRQLLRDVTTQPDPFNIDWPICPVYVKN